MSIHLCLRYKLQWTFHRNMSLRSICKTLFNIYRFIWFLKVQDYFQYCIFENAHIITLIGNSPHKLNAGMHVNLHKCLNRSGHFRAPVVWHQYYDFLRQSHYLHVFNVPSLRQTHRALFVLPSGNPFRRFKTMNGLFRTETIVLVVRWEYVSFTEHQRHMWIVM